MYDILFHDISSRAQMIYCIHCSRTSSESGIGICCSKYVDATEEFLVRCCCSMVLVSTPGSWFWSSLLDCIGWASSRSTTIIKFQIIHFHIDSTTLTTFTGNVHTVDRHMSHEQIA